MIVRAFNGLSDEIRDQTLASAARQLSSATRVIDEVQHRAVDHDLLPSETACRSRWNWLGWGVLNDRAPNQRPVSVPEVVGSDLDHSVRELTPTDRTRDRVGDNSKADVLSRRSGKREKRA